MFVPRCLVWRSTAAGNPAAVRASPRTESTARRRTVRRRTAALAANTGRGVRSCRTRSTHCLWRSPRSRKSSPVSRTCRPRRGRCRRGSLAPSHRRGRGCCGGHKTENEKRITDLRSAFRRTDVGQQQLTCGAYYAHSCCGGPTGKPLSARRISGH